MLRHRVVCFVAGVAATLALVGPARVPADRGAARGADVRVVIDRSSELDVAPHGTVLGAAGLRPGRRLSGRVVLRNRTGSVLHVRLRAQATSRDLDRSLLLRVDADGRLVHDGRLESLRRWTRPLALEPGERMPLALGLSLTRTAHGHEGRAVAVTLETGA